MNTEIIKEIDVQSVMTKSSLPVGGYSVNPYVGCPHACTERYDQILTAGRRIFGQPLRGLSPRL